MKTVVLYGSLTGNTEYVAHQISDFLNKNKIEHHLVNVAEFSPQEILNYDVLIIGCATWDYGQLQDDFKLFFAEIQNLDFTGKKLAAFGCGDSNYIEFCEAVKIIEQFWTSKKAEKIIAGLKIDGFPQQTSNQKLLATWLNELIKQLK
jgi:flavodoxin short chain